MIVQGYIKGIGIDGITYPLPHASVKVKGTTQGTTANENGYFQLDVPVGAILQFSFVLHETFEKVIFIGNNVLNITLKELENVIDDVKVELPIKKSNGWKWVLGGLALASLFLVKPENPKKVTIK